MPPTKPVYLSPGMLPAIIVVAISVIAALVIIVWLLYQVACRAIDKVPPEGVTPLILALGVLVNAFRSLLPWLNRSEPIQLPPDLADPVPPSLHNETSPELTQEAKHEA